MISCKSGSNVAKGTAGSVSNEKPKYVFMFIGDGLSHVQANAARVYLGNNTVGEVELANLAFTSFPVNGIATTQDSTSFCPDSASTATSFSCGVKTHSGVIGKLVDKTKDAKNLSEYFKEQGWKIGIVSTVTLNHATPAANAKGDIVWAIIEQDKDGKIIFTNMIDHYRITKEIILFLCFAILLLLVSGFTGFRTILSFIFTLLCIWKLIIPLSLKGYPPLLISLVIGNIIAISTILLVAGLKKYSYVAILSSVIASVVTGIVAIIMTHYFKIDGAVMEASESLLYSGFQHLNLTQIFQGSVYLASSGAILDLSIDVLIHYRKLLFTGYTLRLVSVPFLYKKSCV